MKNRFSITAAVVLLSVQVVSAQVIFDSSESILVYEDVSWGNESVYVGVSNSLNGLTIDESLIVLAGDLFEGYYPASSNNWVSLRNNSQLLLGGTLFVGFEGSSNSFSTGSGVSIYTANGGVLGYATDSTDNLMTVAGDNTLWISDSEVSVGYGGSSNRLEILDGAGLSVNGSLWIGLNDSANGNSMLISDSIVATRNAVIVGYEGAENRLDVVNGSLLVSADGFVGLTNGANDNLILVSGSGSVWTNAGSLYIGNEDNSGNMISVTNQGLVVVQDGFDIEGTNSFNLNRDGQLSVLSDFDASLNGFHFNAGGILNVSGDLTGMTNQIDGGRQLGLMGEEARWDLNGNDAVVGGNLSGSMLRIEGSAAVKAGGMVVGLENSATGNTVTVTGTGSLLELSGDLSVGTAGNADNSVEVSDGGRVQLGGNLNLGGTENEFVLGDGGWLVAGNGMDASPEGFSFLSGGTLESMGTLSGLTNALEDGRNLFLTGSNAVWDLGAEALTVGGTSSFNELRLTNGAWLAAGDVMIGSLASTGNVVYISGSTWTNAGNLGLNGYNNNLMLASGADVGVSQTLSVRNQSTLSFTSNGHASASDYYQDASSIFAFDSTTNSLSSPALLVVDDAAEFDAGATVEYTGEISGLERGIVFTNRLVDAGVLIVDGVTNAAGSDLDALNIAGLGTLLTIDLVSENDDLMALIMRMRLADSAGFADGTTMAAVSDEIDQMADDGNMLADNMINTLSQLDSADQNQQLSQLYDRHAPTYSHAKGMLDGFKQARMRSVVPDPLLPIGPLGPHFYGDQVQGWIKGYGSRGQRDGFEDFSGYDQSIYGVLLGVDKSYGNLLAGVAGGMATTDISQDDGDDSEATTGYGLVYASWGTVSWFGDINLGYGRSTIEDRSGTVFDTRADYAANQLGFYAGGGRELLFMNDRLFLTPSAALSSYYYLQDSYTEKSSTAIPRRVDAFDYFSVKSELGLKVSYSHELESAALVPELHANWLHEFNTDGERVDYSLVGGTGNYSFAMATPLEDLYELGGGLSFWTRGPSGVVYEWYVGLDGRFGDGYSEQAVSLRLLSQF